MWRRREMFYGLAKSIKFIFILNAKKNESGFKNLQFKITENFRKERETWSAWSFVSKNLLPQHHLTCKLMYTRVLKFIALATGISSFQNLLLEVFMKPLFLRTRPRSIHNGVKKLSFHLKVQYWSSKSAICSKFWINYCLKCTSCDKLDWAMLSS